MAANIELRKRNQALEQQVAGLQQDLQAARARIVGMEQRTGTLATLPQDRLDALFTVHDVEIGRLTGGADLARDGGFDEGIKVYVTPRDSAGDALKATGRLVIRTFDLANPPVLLGEWTFSPEQLKPLWVGFGLVRGFVIELPWKTVPQTPELVVRIEFEDALTGRIVTATRQVRANPPPAGPAQATTEP